MVSVPYTVLARIAHNTYRWPPWDAMGHNKLTPMCDRRSSARNPRIPFRYTCKPRQTVRQPIHAQPTTYD
eukprot:6353205-Alexandrium_andersonii.AAC.1